MAYIRLARDWVGTSYESVVRTTQPRKLLQPNQGCMFTIYSPARIVSQSLSASCGQETSAPQLQKRRNASSALLRSRQKRTCTGVSTACRNIHINPHLFLTCPPAPQSKVLIAKATLFLVEHFTCVRLALLVKASELPSQAFCRVP